MCQFPLPSTVEVRMRVENFQTERTNWCEAWPAFLPHCLFHAYSGVAFHTLSFSLSLCLCAATVFGSTLKTYLAGRTSPNGRRPQCKLKRHMERDGMVQDGLRAKPTRTIFARASRARNGERAPATRFELVRLGKKSLKYDFEEI